MLGAEVGVGGLGVSPKRAGGVLHEQSETLCVGRGYHALRDLALRVCRRRIIAFNACV